jgi:cellulose synthase/poly-beta-1,6-N-acetylglucosamine synthase-like glycosyltransferase
LEDIFDHSADLEVGIDNQARPYTSLDSNGVSDNLAFCCTGYFREVPYVIVVKVGRDDEQDRPKPGNRGKRDSQLLVYNFFHYVNYRRLWSPLFENLEFKMRICLNIDARDAMYMLVVDCDTEVQQTGISYLVNQLQNDPKLIGACGYTGVSNPRGSFVASSQVFEYWLTHAVLKAVESMCSNVLVLSGCFAIYRLKWPNNRPAILHPLLLEDFAGSYDKTLHEHNLLSIGEDRYLSTLAIRYFGSDCRLRYFSAATCTTTVPDNLSVLLDQRRRWTNSLIHCHFAHLNVLPFEASFWTHLRLLFVIGAELFMVFILPLALPAGLVLAVVSVLLTNYAWAILLAFFLLPVAICILCNDWRYIPFYLPFFPMIAVFSIIIPLFSVWKQDNVRWGKTRGG